MIKKILVTTLTLLCIFFVITHYEDIVGFLSVKPKPDFEISVNPNSVTLNNWEGSSTGVVITVKSISGFSENITFEVVKVYLVGDICFTFDPPQVFLPSNEQVQCTLTMYVSSFVPSAEYRIDINGIAGNLKHSVHITITIPS